MLNLDCGDTSPLSEGATSRAGRSARHPQAPEKRRRAGALQKMKFGVLANLVPIALSCIFNYVLINKALCSS